MLEVLVNRHCPRSRFLRGAAPDERKLRDSHGAQGQSLRNLRLRCSDLGRFGARCGWRGCATRGCGD